MKKGDEEEKKSDFNYNCFQRDTLFERPLQRSKEFKNILTPPCKRKYLIIKAPLGSLIEIPDPGVVLEHYRNLGFTDSLISQY